MLSNASESPGLGLLPRQRIAQGPGQIHGQPGARRHKEDAPDPDIRDKQQTFRQARFMTHDLHLRGRQETCDFAPMLLGQNPRRDPAVEHHAGKRRHAPAGPARPGCGRG